MFVSAIKEWGGESVITKYDHPSGVWIFIAVHSTKLGPATGGTRMKPYPKIEDALQDALKLSKGMTYKFAVPDLPLGGGKAVICLPEKFDPKDRTDLLKRYGSLIHQLGGLYYTGPDIGTSSEDMDMIAETGSPYVFSRTPEAGGAGSSGPFTSLGVFAAVQVICENLFGKSSLKGRRVLVQGVGSVGGGLIDYLMEEKAVVLFNDVDDDLISHYRDDLGLEFVPIDLVYSTECDLFSPCALGGILNSQTIPQLKCKAIVGGANNQLASPEDGKKLQEQGIFYAPDYVVNVGGAMGITGIETWGWSRGGAETKVSESIQKALKDIFELVDSEGISPEEAAQKIADKRLSITS